jgi:drug/metabolite transporter (DMT)-like permease
MDLYRKKGIRRISNLLLLLTAVIWGLAFVAQSVGMDYVQPCTFIFIRFLIGGIVLLPVIMVMDHKQKKTGMTKIQKAWGSETLKAGISCGLALGSASLAQQYGIQYTSVGKAGFITTLYIIIVPFLGLFVGLKCSLKVWISGLIAVFGLFMICMTETFHMSKGDILVLLCAFFFSIQILLVNYYSSKANPIKISCIEFFTASLVGGIGVLIFETPKMEDIMAAATPILYAGVMSSGLGYTLQVVAQRNTDPMVASLIMSLESVFATIAGWLLLNQHLSAKEMIGCTLVFAAIILIQLPEKK